MGVNGLMIVLFASMSLVEKMGGSMVMSICMMPSEIPGGFLLVPNGRREFDCFVCEGLTVGKITG